MSQLARQVKAYFDDKKLNYETRTGENEETLIRAGFEMKNSPAVSIIMVFPKDEQACKLFAYDIIQFKAARRSEEYKFCNEVNVRYRWVKFYAEEQADNITATMDILLPSEEMCGEKVFASCMNFLGIIDEACGIHNNEV
ncbi:MAG: YbjN domain-containing protein [Neisseriaceae bacterium]|nr:YbjN domain-containing protein [Neisseriaceae bacterium]MBR5674883.1 YbjN domain-containing protein [Neisseriaceae bacterium]MBR5940337.1 YbjN domain-containing protein [Neisseriaceae bacterium]